MNATSLVIVADRGGLRAYRVEETATQKAKVTLTQAFDIPEADAEARTHHAVPRSDLPQLETETNVASANNWPTKRHVSLGRTKWKVGQSLCQNQFPQRSWSICRSKSASESLSM